MVVGSKCMVNKELLAMLGCPGQIRLLDISSALGEAGRLTVIISASANLSPMYINVLTASGSRLGGRGVKGDS